MPLNDIVVTVTLGRRTEDGGFQDLPNAIYLPLIGTSSCVAYQADLTVKPQNVAQIVLRPEAALASYVAGFFNTDLGRMARDTLCSGFIPKISKGRLSDVILFLPPVDVQADVVSLNNSLRETRVQLDTLSKSLWDRPRQALKLKKRILAFESQQTFESWLETVPFPLASILWRYRADATPRNKRDHLLWFFEATTYFAVSLILSAFHSDRAFLEGRKKALLSGDQPEFRKVNFGQWVIFGERLAKLTRSLLSGGERDLCLDLYKTRRLPLVEALISKRFYAALKSVADYRNLRAHGGAEGDAEVKRRLTQLEHELTVFRELFTDAFDDYLLLKPGEATYSAGTFEWKVKCLMGTRTIFPEEHIRTSVPMETERLYWLDRASSVPLELLPFFRIMPSPESEENACYFYNRVQKDGIRWVSYHFESKSEDVRPDDNLTAVLQELEASTGE